MVWGRIEGKLVYDCDNIQNEYWNWEELFDKYLQFECVDDYGFRIVNNQHRTVGCDRTGEVYLIVTEWDIEIHPRAQFRWMDNEEQLLKLKEILYGFFKFCREIEDLDINGELIADELKCYYGDKEIK